MMFVHLLIILFFAAIEAIPTGRFDVVYPSMETFRSGIKRIRFRALGQDIELRLEPAGDVIADDFAVINGKNGEVDHSVDIQSLKRNLYKDEKVGAALHIDEDGPLTINGIINSKLRIQPDTSKMANKNGRIAHRLIEVIKDKHLRHGYKTLPPGFTRTFNYSKPLSDDKCVKIEYVFVTESNFTEKFKSHSVTMETYLANMMNIAEMLLGTFDLGIKVAIIGIIKLTKENEAKLAPYIPSYPTGIDALDTAVKMAKFYCTSTDNLILKADVVMLISSRPLGTLYDNGTFVNDYAGMASNVNGACLICHKYALVSDNSVANERADTVAHETAHTLGCHHDGEETEVDCPASDGYIMGDRNEKNGKKFSPCCKKRVEKTIITEKGIGCMVETCDAKRKRK